MDRCARCDRRRSVKIALAVVFAGLLHAWTGAVAAAPEEGLLPGTPAPGFSARRLEGGTLSLRSLRGKVVLLDFWSPSCPPCTLEMPELEKLHRRYEERGLRVLGVTEMDPSAEEVRSFLHEIGVTYPILLDPGARIGSLYRLVAHPTSVLIDRRGIVRYANVGYLRGEEKEIERAILELLGPGAREDGAGEAATPPAERSGKP